MRIFYYVHTGHRVGLDRFRRACTIIRALKDSVDITLLTSDFRIASVAKEHGVDRAVGIDVVRNIPHIASYGDKLIFDSDEANPIMMQDMVEYFSTFIHISDNENITKQKGGFLVSPYLEGDGVCRGIVVDDRYTQESEKIYERSLFFGDDDYEEDLFKHQECFRGFEFNLLEGFYWFFNYSKKLEGVFEHIVDEESYDQVIKRSKTLLTASPQAVLENLASGGKPIYLQREDYEQNYTRLFSSLGVPIVSRYDKKILSTVLEQVETNSYKKCPNSTPMVIKFIKTKLN